jgi:glycosyltransferase involved in cell wall biosynthesis
MGARVFLGKDRYLGFRERLWQLGPRLTRPSVQVRQLRAQLTGVSKQFKSHVLRSMIRQRALEKELAQFRYPGLYRADLDVTAEIVQQGKMPVGSGDSVSVVITNYNYRQYLPETIDSVFAQTHADSELIIVDDASTDGSPDVLEGLLGRAGALPATRLLLKHNVGLPTARNLGLRLAQGEFVFILDADNRLLKPCLELHVRTARDTGADAVYSSIQTAGGASHVPRVLSNAPFSADKLSTGNYIDAMALFRRSALLEAGLYSTEPALYGFEDYELWLRFAAQGRRVEFIPTVLSEYRVHEQNMITVAKLDMSGVRAHLRAKYPGIVSDEPEQ